MLVLAKEKKTFKSAFVAISMPKAKTHKVVFDAVWEKNEPIKHYKAAIPLQVQFALKKYHSKRILDLGSGDGTNIVALAHQGYDCTGLDISSVGVKKAKKYAKATGISIDVRVRDIYKPLPFDSKSFDAVITLQAINHNTRPNIIKSFEEIYRVLKRGGLFCIKINDWALYHFKDLGNNILYDTDWKMKFKKTDVQTIVPLEGEEKGLVHYCFQAEELKDTLEEVGFSRIYAGKTKYHLLGVFQKK